MHVFGTVANVAADSAKFRSARAVPECRVGDIARHSRDALALALRAVTMAVVTDDRSRIRSALEAAGIQGSDDFGHFVNDTRYVPASKLHERAAFPILLSVFPSLSERWSVEATARYIGKPWARPVAFEPLLVAFKKWGLESWSVGWVLGDCLANNATPKDLATLLELAEDNAFGRNRQMIVYSL
jgi:hypothetical protein